MNFMDRLKNKQQQEEEEEYPILVEQDNSLPNGTSISNFNINQPDGSGFGQMPNHQMPQGIGQAPNQQMPQGIGQAPNQQMPQGMGQAPNHQMPQGMGQAPNHQMPQGMGQAPNQQMPQGMGQMPNQQMPQGMGQMPNGVNQPNQMDLVHKNPQNNNGMQMPINLQDNPGNIGGDVFNREQGRNNPLADRQRVQGNNLDNHINTIPALKVMQKPIEAIDPEYYGSLAPFFNNTDISTIHMYGHNLISLGIKGEDVLGQSIWKTEEEYIDFLESLINWNNKVNPVDLNKFRNGGKTFGTYYMKDLSRLHISVTDTDIYATIAVKRQDALSLDDLSTKFGMMNDNIKTFIVEAIRANCKILLAGQGGAGKTTFIQACSNLINDKTVTLVAEEYREIVLNRNNVKYVSANDSGRPLEKIVAESTKMRIRNLIVGEIIGSEALAMLEAMNTGLDVVLATTHANGCFQALDRITVLACKNPNINPVFIKYLIGDNLDLVVYLEEVNGKKMVSEIIGIERYQWENDKIIANTIYNFKQGKTNINRSTTSRIMKKIEESKKYLRGQ